MIHLKVTDASFKTKVLESPIPVAVLFCGPWCELCRKASPLMEDIAGHYAGRVRIMRIDMLKNKKSVARFGVRALPTLLFFKAGKAVDAMLGLQPKAEIKHALDMLLAVRKTARGQPHKTVLANAPE